MASTVEILAPMLRRKVLAASHRTRPLPLLRMTMVALRAVMPSLVMLRLRLPPLCLSASHETFEHHLYIYTDILTLATLIDSSEHHPGYNALNYHKANSHYGV